MYLSWLFFGGGAARLLEVTAGFGYLQLLLLAGLVIVFTASLLAILPNSDEKNNK